MQTNRSSRDYSPGDRHLLLSINGHPQRRPVKDEKVDSPEGSYILKLFKDRVEKDSVGEPPVPKLRVVIRINSFRLANFDFKIVDNKIQSLIPHLNRQFNDLPSCLKFVHDTAAFEPMLEKLTTYSLFARRDQYTVERQL